MFRAKLVKIGGTIVSIAVIVLGITVPSTTWITENKAVHISIVAIIALLIGGLMWFWGIKMSRKEQAITKLQTLNSIAPTLQQMHTLLRHQAVKQAKKAYDKKTLSDLNNRVNIEIFRFSEKEIEKVSQVKSIEQAYAVFNELQNTMIRKYGNKQLDWFKTSEYLSGVYDENGFGLKNIRNKGKYKKYSNLLSQYRTNISDYRINDEIKNHIKDSEIVANMLLMKNREPDFREYLDGKEFGALSFMSLPLVGNYGNFERNTNERLEQRRVTIKKYIDELEKKL
jgi:hypothetical protein